MKKETITAFLVWWMMLLLPACADRETPASVSLPKKFKYADAIEKIEYRTLFRLPLKCFSI